MVVNEILLRTMKCIVPSCGNDSRETTKSQKISFHSLPVEPSRRAAWLRVLGDVNWKITDRSVVVCSRHFLSEDIYVSRGRWKLRAGAVPVLNQKTANGFECTIKPCNVKVVRLQTVNGQAEEGTGFSSKWRGVKVCRICLATECKLYPTNVYESLDRAYETLAGLSIKSDVPLPPYLCGECAQRLRNCVHFRARTLRARTILADIAKKHDYITIQTLKSINCTQIRSSLSITHQQPDYCDVHVECNYKDDVDPQVDSYDLEIKTEKEEVDSDYNEDSAIMEELIYRGGEGAEEDSEVNDDETHLSDQNNDEPIEELKSIAELVVFPSEATPDDRPDKRPNFRITPKTKIKGKLHSTKLKRGRKRKSQENNFEVDSDTDFVDNHTADRMTKRKKHDTVGQKMIEEVNCQESVSDSELLTECPGGKSEEEKLKILDKRLNGLRRRLRDSLDPSVFTVTSLTLEEQVREVRRRQHQPAYTNARYKCAECFRGFNIKHCYDAHILKHHESSGAYVCVVCRVRTRSAVALRKHLTATHTRLYSCNVCPFVSRHKGAAMQHQNFHAGIIYRCPHCPMFSNNYTTYQNHVRIKHPSQFACSLCGYTFANDKGLYMHKKIKHKLDAEPTLDGPYCEACDVRFASDEAHVRHLQLSSVHCNEDDPNRIPNDPQKMWCESVRARRPRGQSAAAGGRESGQPAPSGPVVCEQCGEQLASRRAYAQHFRYEHPDKNRTQFPSYKSLSMCELCGQVFHCNALLMSHMWVRHGVGEWRPAPQRPRSPRADQPAYVCPICDKLFTVKFNFERHVFNHTGQRPYKCDECPKSFKSRTEKRTHTEHVHLKKPWPKRVRARPRRPKAARGVPEELEVAEDHEAEPVAAETGSEDQSPVYYEVVDE